MNKTDLITIIKNSHEDISVENIFHHTIEFSNKWESKHLIDIESYKTFLTLEKQIFLCNKNKFAYIIGLASTDTLYIAPVFKVKILDSKYALLLTSKVKTKDADNIKLALLDMDSLKLYPILSTIKVNDEELVLISDKFICMLTDERYVIAFDSVFTEYKCSSWHAYSFKKHLIVFSRWSHIFLVFDKVLNLKMKDKLYYIANSDIVKYQQAHDFCEYEKDFEYDRLYYTKIEGVIDCDTNKPVNLPNFTNTIESLIFEINYKGSTYYYANGSLYEEIYGEMAKLSGNMNVFTSSEKVVILTNNGLKVYDTVPKSIKTFHYHNFRFIIMTFSKYKKKMIIMKKTEIIHEFDFRSIKAFRTILVKEPKEILILKRTDEPCVVITIDSKTKSLDIIEDYVEVRTLDCRHNIYRTSDNKELFRDLKRIKLPKSEFC